MTRKKPEVIRALQHGDGTVEEQYSDGSKKLIDPKNPLGLPTMQEIENFLEDLKKDPTNRLLREYANAYLKKLPYIEDDKVPATDILDKISELLNVKKSPSGQGAPVTINIFSVNNPEKKKTINVEAQIKEIPC